VVFDKVALLRELHKGQVVAGFFLPAPQFDEAEAKRAVTSYIDYFQGRAIKTDLSKDMVCPRLYDRDAGQGAFMRALGRVK